MVRKSTLLAAVALATVAASASAQDVVMRRPLPNQPGTQSGCGTQAGSGFFSDPGCSTVDTTTPTPTDNPWIGWWSTGDWQGQAACGEESRLHRTVNCVQWRYTDPDNGDYSAQEYKVADEICLANPEAGPKPPSSYVGEEAGCTYKLEYTEFGDWDSTCSYNATRTRTASCTKDGAPVDMALCASGIGADGQLNPETTEYRTDYTGCQFKWKYNYEGYTGFSDPFTGEPNDGYNTFCREDTCGNLVNWRYFPPRCYMIAPDGSERPAPAPGTEGMPEYQGDVPPGTNGYPGDFTCIMRGLPRPAPLRSEETVLHCRQYGWGGMASQYETEDTVDGNGKLCTGPMIASFKVAYGQTDPSQIQQFCASHNAGCCAWHGDPTENAPNGHTRMWTIQAHKGTSWAPADEDNSTFSWRAMIGWDETGFGKPIPWQIKDVADVNAPVQSCQTTTPPPVPVPDIPEQPPVVPPTPPTPPDVPHVDETGIYYSPCRKTSGGGNHACGEGTFGVQYGDTRIPFPEDFCSGSVIAGAYWNQNGQQVGPSLQTFVSPGWASKPPVRNVEGAQCVVHYKQGYSHHPQDNIWVSIYFDGAPKPDRPSQVDYMAPKP